MKGVSTFIAKVSYSSRIPWGVNSGGSSRFASSLPDILPLAERSSGKYLNLQKKVVNLQRGEETRKINKFGLGKKRLRGLYAPWVVRGWISEDALCKAT